MWKEFPCDVTISQEREQPNRVKSVEPRYNKVHYNTCRTTTENCVHKRNILRVGDKTIGKYTEKT